MREYERQRMERLVIDYASTGRGMTMYGLPVSEFTQEQLFAMIGYLAVKVKEAREKHEKALDDAFRRPPRASDMW